MVLGAQIDSSNNNVPAAAALLRGAAGRFAGDINVPVYATVKGVRSGIVFCLTTARGAGLGYPFNGNSFISEVRGGGGGGADRMNRKTKVSIERAPP